MQLATLNGGRLLAPLDSPRIAEFVAQLEPINRLADGSPGVGWRLYEACGGPIAQVRSIVGSGTWPNSRNVA